MDASLLTGRGGRRRHGAHNHIFRTELIVLQQVTVRMFGLEIGHCFPDLPRIFSLLEEGGRQHDANTEVLLGDESWGLVLLRRRHDPRLRAGGGLWVWQSR